MLVYAGPVRTTSTGALTIDAGGKVQYDDTWASSNTTTVNYPVGLANSGSVGMTMAINGTECAGTEPNLSCATHVQFQGDASLDSYVSSITGTALQKAAVCTAGACLSGSIVWSGNAANDMGYGTWSWVDILNNGGTSNGGNLSSFEVSVSAHNAVLTGVTVNGSPFWKVNVVSGATANLTIDRSGAFTSTYASVGQGSVQFNFPVSASGTYSVTNSSFDGLVTNNGGTSGVQTWKNNYYYAGLTGTHMGSKSGDREHA